MKTIQGLSKRKGVIAYVRSDKTEDDFGPFRVGDFAHVVHQNGGNAVLRIDILQKEGKFIGTVMRCFPKIGGIDVGDVVIEHHDFVFALTRGDMAGSEYK